MGKNLNYDNTVFYSTANDSYIYNSATSLLSIRSFNPNAKLYILSKEISKKNKRFLKRKNIEFIELDLTYLFFQTWDYPIECFYLFAGPKLFHNLGFKYSIYIDGDIVCLNDPLKNINTISDFGGVEANRFSELFGNEQNLIAEITETKLSYFDKKRFNSGVIYMNNERLVSLGFLEKSSELFYECWEKGIPRKGDDSLFALFLIAEHKNLSLVKLPSAYNYMPHFQNGKNLKSLVFFHFTLDKPWKSRPYMHPDVSQNIYNCCIKKWRQVSIKTSLTKWLGSLFALRIIKKIIIKIHHFAKATPFVLQGIRYPLIQKRKNLKKPPIKLYWWQPPHINNFGDIVSKDIIINLFGINCVYSPLEKCDLMAAGSIIELLQQTKREANLYVWGSGFINQDSDDNNLGKAIFKAVRGKKTKQRIKKQVPTGDPGILINATYALKKKRHSNTIGVVIHYADIKSEITKKFCEDDRFCVISPLDSPSNVAQKISKCKLILSSSLHGLIFADSLSIPNAHIKLTDNLTGGLYKFKDYCSGVNKPYTPADISKLFDDDYLQNLINSYKPIPNLAKTQRDLIKSFPF